MIQLRLDTSPKPSAWNLHPSQNENGLYKFSSLEINLDQRKYVLVRRTGDLLEWFGDLGGFKAMLFTIGSLFISSYASYNLNSLLLTTFFRMMPSQTQSESI